MHVICSFFISIETPFPNVLLCVRRASYCHADVIRMGSYWETLTIGWVHLCTGCPTVGAMEMKTMVGG